MNWKTNCCIVLLSVQLTMWLVSFAIVIVYSNASKLWFKKKDEKKNNSKRTVNSICFNCHLFKTEQSNGNDDWFRSFLHFPSNPVLSSPFLFYDIIWLMQYIYYICWMKAISSERAWHLTMLSELVYQ